MTYKILEYGTVRSTNNTAYELAVGGFPEGTVVCANDQTNGRGKGNRRWVSPRGKDLLFSILLRPPWPLVRIPLLTQIAAKSVSLFLSEHCRIQNGIKRPNDILVKGKKICGILVESSSKKDIPLFSIVGIGLNVNSESHELIEGATSLYSESGKRAEKSVVLNGILNIFRDLYMKSSLGVR